jgi:hypothetical protein
MVLVTLVVLVAAATAMIAAGQLALEHPGTWEMAFQSETTRPSKPMRPLRTSVIR